MRTLSPRATLPHPLWSPCIRANYLFRRGRRLPLRRLPDPIVRPIFGTADRTYTFVSCCFSSFSNPLAHPHFCTLHSPPLETSFSISVDFIPFRSRSVPSVFIPPIPLPLSHKHTRCVAIRYGWNATTGLVDCRIFCRNSKTGIDCDSWLRGNHYAWLVLEYYVHGVQEIVKYASNIDRRWLKSKPSPNVGPRTYFVKQKNKGLKFILFTLNFFK